MITLCVIVIEIIVLTTGLLEYKHTYALKLN